MAKFSTPAEAIEYLYSISPCPVIHGMHELPETDWMHGKRKRSCYLPQRKGRWTREQDYIVMNVGEARHWKYVSVLAHEIGHALDHHGLHPAQKFLRGSRSSRYRVELAAVAFELAFLKAIGRSRKKFSQRRVKSSTSYLNRYAQGTAPSLASILKHTKITF